MSDIATENAVNASRKAINDAVNHFFTYRIGGTARVVALDDFIVMFIEIQPHLFFTQQSLDNIKKKMTDKASTYQLIMNLTLYFYSRLFLMKGDLEKLISHLTDTAGVTLPQITEHLGNLQPDMQKEWINAHASQESVNKALSNNRHYMMLYIAVLFLNIEPIVRMRDELMKGQEGKK